MKQLVQGSSDWHSWRLGGIGASEVPVLMGESDFSTPLKIWKIKTGIEKEKNEPNYVMQRGTDAEPKIRALYELYNDIDMPACLVQHPEFPFIRASLDGYNEEQRLVLEIKYPGKEKHQMAVEGKVPTCYYGQVQAQLLAARARKAHYVSFDGEKIAVVEVLPDPDYIDRMISVLKEFWRCVETKTPPGLSDQDFKTLDSPDAVQLFEQWRKNKLIEMQVQDELEQLKAKMLPLVDHARIECAGVQVVRNKRGVLSFTLKGA